MVVVLVEVEVVEALEEEVVVNVEAVDTRRKVELESHESL